MTQDPYKTLTYDEQKLVDELLYGPIDEAAVEQSIKDAEDATIASEKSDGRGAGSIRGEALSSKMESWADGEESIPGTTVGGGSVVSGITNKDEGGECETYKIVVPTPKREKKATGTDIYAKNKQLLQAVESSRFKRYLDELATKKPPKTAAALKSLNNIALSIMKDEKNSRDIVAALNGVQIIVQNIIQQPKFEKNAKVVGLSITILGNLAKNSDERRALILQENGVLLLLSIMQKFSTKELLVQEEAVIALYNIVQDQANAIQFTETPQALHVVVRTMKALKSRASVQKACFGILLRLAHVDFDYVAKPDIFELCISSLSKNKSLLPLQKVGCIFWRQVATLADEDGFELKMLVTAEVPQYLIQAMKNHAGDTYVSHNAFATLAIIGERNTSGLAILTNNLGDIMKIILKQKSDVDTQREAYKVLRLMRGLPAGSLRIPRSLAENEEIRNAFHRAQIDPSRVLPV